MISFGVKEIGRKFISNFPKSLFWDFRWLELLLLPSLTPGMLIYQFLIRCFPAINMTHFAPACPFYSQYSLPWQSTRRDFRKKASVRVKISLLQISIIMSWFGARSWTKKKIFLSKEFQRKCFILFKSYCFLRQISAVPFTSISTTCYCDVNSELAEIEYNLLVTCTFDKS